MKQPKSSQAPLLPHTSVQEEMMKAIKFVCGCVDGIGHFKGGCGEPVSVWDAYRCADCTASFHRDCLSRHLEGETEKDTTIAKLNHIVDLAKRVCVIHNSEAAQLLKHSIDRL